MEKGRKESGSLKLTPTLSGNGRGEPLFSYFRERLPPGLRSDVYEGLSCDGYSRLIASDLGGPRKAKIFRVDKVVSGDRPQDAVSHSYVIPENAKPNDLAYNNWWGDRKTVAEVLSEGKDITDEVFSTPWERL